jgi:threonine synthase
MVYYVYAYTRLVASGVVKAGEEINVVVPTGNFGNILAAYYAAQMGLPVKKFICASNDNKVLYDFFTTGEYDRNRDFILTTSPSMDILISSNLERLIYRIAGNDAEKNAELMKSLNETGKYTITDEMKKNLYQFYGNFATTEEVAATIHTVYDEDGYVLDTHTAVAVNVYDKYKAETGDKTPTVIASRASPYKFTTSVVEALLDSPEGDRVSLASLDDFALVDELEKLSSVKIPQAVEEIRTAPIMHETVCEKEEMEAVVKSFLGIE